MKILISIFALFATIVFNTDPIVIYEEDFSGDELDERMWNYDVGNGCPQLCGWGNKERQYYTKNNVYLREGKLVIQARNLNGKITSGKIHTQNKIEFQYGSVEVRAKLPEGTGTWPAIWMLGSDIDEKGWPECGEIDIMEYSGKHGSTLHTSLHTPSSHGNTINTQKSQVRELSAEFHDYRMDWTTDSISFYIDDMQLYSYEPTVKNPKTWPFDKPFYLIINLAIGGSFTGYEVNTDILPQELIIDHIKITQN